MNEFVEYDTYHLRLPPTLHHRPSPTIPRNSLHVIRKSRRQASQTHDPKHKTKRQTSTLLERRRLVLQVERYEDRDGHEGEVC